MKNIQMSNGIRDSVPFGIGFIPLYISIGMLAAINGFNITQVMATTIAIFSTPLQFLLVQSLNNGYILIPIILTLNARFLLMSATLSPYFRQTTLSKMALSSVLVVPSVVTGCLIRFKKHHKGTFTYFISLGISIYVVSIISTLIGFIFGHKLQLPIMKYLINVTLPLQFTALAAKHWPDYLYILTYWMGFLIAPLLIHTFHTFTLTIGPFIIGAIAVIISEGKKHA